MLLQYLWITLQDGHGVYDRKNWTYSEYCLSIGQDGRRGTVFCKYRNNSNKDIKIDILVYSE